MLKKRVSYTVPFGWKLLEDDDEVIESIDLEIEALEIANWYILNGYTLQSTRDWLVNKTGRSITVPGMVKALKRVGYRNPTTKEVQAEEGQI